MRSTSPKCQCVAKMAAVRHFGFVRWTTHEVFVVVLTGPSNFVLIKFVVSEILLLIYCGIFAWICLFTSAHAQYHGEIYFRWRKPPTYLDSGGQVAYSISTFQKSRFTNKGHSFLEPAMLRPILSWKFCRVPSKNAPKIDIFLHGGNCGQ